MLTTLHVVADAAAQDVPSSWSRFRGEFDFDSPEVQCAFRTGTSWILSLDDAGHVVERAEPTENLHRHRDPLPYHIEFHPAMLGPYPPPPRPPLVDATTGKVIEDNFDYDASARDLLRNHANTTVVQTEDGWLVGFSAGEFGGSLWWFPASPGAGRKLLDGNVQFIIRHAASGDLFAALGLAHMGGDSGALHIVQRDETGTWIAPQVSDLGSVPAAFATTASGDLLVATIKSVVAVRSDGIVRHLAAIEHGIGQPESVLLAPSGDIFVGLRFFILRLHRTLVGYEAEYYIPRGCQRFHYEPVYPGDDTGECVCDGGVPGFRTRRDNRQR